MIDELDKRRLGEVLSENARKNMAGRIYAAYVARGAVTSTSIEEFLNKAVKEADELLSKLELPK